MVALITTPESLWSWVPLYTSICLKELYTRKKLTICLYVVVIDYDEKDVFYTGMGSIGVNWRSVFSLRDSGWDKAPIPSSPIWKGGICPPNIAMTHTLSYQLDQSYSSTDGHFGIAGTPLVSLELSQCHQALK